jgi:hypothetical protein
LFELRRGLQREDVAIDGWCAECDDARADDLRAQAEELERCRIAEAA